ncbi:MAG: YfhO family protein [Acidimicrobiales bacterium]
MSSMGEGSGVLEVERTGVAPHGAITPGMDTPGRTSAWWHLAAVIWFVAVGIALLIPALSHGGSFGSYDLLSQFGVLRHSMVLHNVQAGDQSDAIIPWTTLAWTQVHHAELPLWNPYAALGTPLAFGWQAGAFSVPALVGYLFPLHLAFTVQVATTLVIAGAGVYALGRVLGLGVLGCVFAGTVFELSGPMIGWLGWPHAAVLSWSGWLFAAALLVIRGEHRARYVILFALAIAATIYAGQAEILTLVGLALLVFLIVVLLLRARLCRPAAIGRPVVDLFLGVFAGGAIGAPLVLPGYQVIAGSQRGVPGGDAAELLKGNPALPVHNALHVLFQGFDGLPVAGSHWFGYANGYSETAVYLGVIALVMGAVAVAIRYRRPEVVGFGVLVVVMAAVAFFQPVVSLLSHMPLIGTVLWQRALLPLAFGLAVLAGIGLDALVRAHHQRLVLRWAMGGFVAASVLLVVLWGFGRGHLPPSDAIIRARSFIWPSVQVALGLAVVGGLMLAHRLSRDGGRPRKAVWRRRGLMAGGVLLVCETAFLISAGAPLWTSTSTPFATTPAELALKRAAGSSVVGFGAPLCFFPPGLGIPVNAQLAYGVQELALYDPMIPNSYFSAWAALTGQPAGNRSDSAYCPVVSTADEARLYGVRFVLEPAGGSGPPGSRYEATIGTETLYSIPGASAATVTPLDAGGRLPPDSAGGAPVHVDHPNPASWTLRLDTSAPQVLRLRLTDVPGWHATIDGRPVALQRFAGVMLQMRVPAGIHTVELNYWPRAFTVGIILALMAVLGLAIAGIASFRSVRRRSGGAGPE